MVALEPDPTTYPVADRIWQRALSGMALRGIARELTEDGVPTPRAAGTWTHTTLGQILKNPIYAGRYYALRFEAIEPEQRQKGYGKSSHRQRTDWLHLEDFPIINPPVSWPEYEYVQDRLTKNKLDSRRNTKRLYILAGMLFCDHERRMAGHQYHQGKYYRYECTMREPGQSACTSVTGPDIEDIIWENVSAFLSDPEVFLTEMERRRGSGATGEAELTSTMATIERSLRKVNESETELVMLKVNGQVSEEAFASASALLRAKRTHLGDEMDRHRAALATLEQSKTALASVVELRDRIIDRLDTATPEDRRWVLQALSTRVTVQDGDLEISLGVPANFVADFSGHNSRVLISRTKLAIAGLLGLPGPRCRASQRL